MGQLDNAEDGAKSKTVIGLRLHNKAFSGYKQTPGTDRELPKGEGKPSCLTSKEFPAQSQQMKANGGCPRMWADRVGLYGWAMSH